VGVRNHVLLIPSVICADVVVERVGGEVPGTVAMPHQHGCAQIGDDYQDTLEALVGMGRNPNVGAAIVLSLGCEALHAEKVVEKIAESGKPVELLRIQEVGGTERTRERAIETARRMAAHLAGQEREEVDFSELAIGVKTDGPPA